MVSKQWIPPLTRIEDIALMDHFVQQGYKPAQLTQLNRCRLYLQAITLAGIVSADGQCMIPDVLAGIPLSDRKSTIQWPNQQRPPPKDWTVWSSALKSLQPRNKLVKPLGEWLVSGTHQSWFWYIDPVLPILYKCERQNNWLWFSTYLS
jgi:hypothetical protein